MHPHPLRAVYSPPTLNLGCRRQIPYAACETPTSEEHSTYYMIISYNSVLHRKLHMYMEGRERGKEEERKERGKGDNERSAMKDPCTPSNGTNTCTISF